MCRSPQLFRTPAPSLFIPTSPSHHLLWSSFRIDVPQFQADESFPCSAARTRFHPPAQVAPPGFSVFRQPSLTFRVPRLLARWRHPTAGIGRFQPRPSPSPGLPRSPLRYVSGTSPSAPTPFHRPCVPTRSQTPNLNDIQTLYKFHQQFRKSVSSTLPCSPWPPG